MKYLFDANVFIEAQNRYYSLDICPGFWDWMDQVFCPDIGTIDKVWSEITQKENDLKVWANTSVCSSKIQSVSDVATQNAFVSIANSISGSGVYSNVAKAKFMDKADPWLIAKAMTTDSIVVTHEVYEPHSKKSVKIPNVCKEFGVKYQNTFTTLRDLKVSFTY